MVAELLQRLERAEAERGIAADEGVKALMAAMAGRSHPSADAAVFLKVSSSHEVSALVLLRSDVCFRGRRSMVLACGLSVLPRMI